MLAQSVIRLTLFGSAFPILSHPARLQSMDGAAICQIKLYYIIFSTYPYSPYVLLRQIEISLLNCLHPHKPVLAGAPSSCYQQRISNIWGCTNNPPLHLHYKYLYSDNVLKFGSNIESYMNILCTYTRSIFSSASYVGRTRVVKTFLPHSRRVHERPNYGFSISSKRIWPSFEISQRMPETLNYWPGAPTCSTLTSQHTSWATGPTCDDSDVADDNEMWVNI